MPKVYDDVWVGGWGDGVSDFTPPTIAMDKNSVRPPSAWILLWVIAFQTYQQEAVFEKLM